MVAMKKGKQLDAHLIGNAVALGPFRSMFQQKQESVIHTSLSGHLHTRNMALGDSFEMYKNQSFPIWFSSFLSRWLTGKGRNRSPMT